MTSVEPTRRLRTEHLFGLDFVADATVEEVAAALVGSDGGPCPVDGRPGWSFLVTANVDHLVSYQRDPRSRAIAERCRFVLPDGTPIVWASHLAGRPLRRRLTGADLFPVLVDNLRQRGTRVVGLAPSDDVAAALMGVLPSGRFLTAPRWADDDDPTTAEVARTLHEAVTETDAQWVLLFLSLVKNHRLAEALAASPLPTGNPVGVALLGASAEFLVGAHRRAPRLLRRAGLEWLFRLVREPRRLWRRYLIDDLAFFAMTWRQVRESRRRTAR